MGDRLGADVDCGWASCEVKHRRHLPAWLLAALVQAHRNSMPGQLPVVVLHEHGQRHYNDLVVVRMGDFIEKFGPLAVPEEETP